jgi:hypothetical protein
LSARRAATVAALSQSAAAASIGAFAASFTEPPAGVRWGLLAGAVVFAGVAAVYQRKAAG